jgi:phenylalanyl-tRNA synthetase beta chain
MKISYNWLKQYLPVDLSPEYVSQALTSAGLEVEDIIPFESVKGSLEGIITGKVVHCERHPNADKLSLTKVDIGSGELLSIVCGAPNVAAGQKVLVATIGTTLYSGEDSFQIKKSKIRGEASEGMICAEDEVGLGTSHDGIMVLPEDVEIGKAATHYFPVEKDVIFEIGLTPNRSDAASHIGVARDLAAILNFRESKKSYKLSLPSVDDFKVENTDLNIEVEIADPEACPRYSGITISNLKIGPSPEWLKNRLKAIGVRPINNVVDVTNYVLFETGQPLHAFDASAVKGNKVVVQKLAEGTTFVTLDEVERKLSANDLIICNAEEGMCIGGVFGGLHSGVSEKTTAIFLESACFDSKTIRKTARLHGLQTDASFRFERGADPEITVYALKRAAQLIKEVAGGVISSEVKDVYPKTIEPAKVHFRFEYLDKIAGQHIPSEQALSILEDLGVEVVKSDQNEAILLVPTFKVDVYRPADIVEEVLRVYGYDNIEIPAKLNASINISEGIDPDKLQHAVSDMLVANGLQEIMNNSLTRSDYSEKHPTFEIEKNVQMLNPLSKDLDVLRQSLLFGGLESIAYNQNRKASDLKLFEFGKVYQFASEKTKNKEALDAYNESLQLDIFLTGDKQSENWNTISAPLDFYDMKFYVEAILRKLRIERNALTVNELSDELFDVALVYSLGKTELLRFGKLSQATTKIFDIRKVAFYANIHWENLLKSLPVSKVKYEAVSRFPAVRRDLALVIDKAIRFEDIKTIAHKTEPVLLQEVNIFDVYEGEKIAEGKKSYAVSFSLVDKEKTLTDKLIDKCMQKLQSAFEQHLGAVLR